MPLRNRARLKRKLVALPKVIREAIRPPLERGVTELTDAQKQAAPVLAEETTQRKPGALRDSINWVYGEAPRGTLSIGKNDPGKGISDVKISVFAGGEDAYWARWVEFGTRKMSAQPFFYPPYRFMNKRIRRSVTSAAKRAIRKLAQNG